METACYYTFSTIAQTLAGAFGFLVAVVLFRMQSLESVLHRIWLRIKDVEHLLASPNQSLLYLSAIKHDWLGVADVLKKASLSRNDRRSRQMLINHSAEFIRVADQLRFIKIDLRSTLMVTGLTIAGSLVALAFTPWVISHGFACIPMTIDVLAAMCSSRCATTWLRSSRNRTALAVSLPLALVRIPH